MSVTVKCVGEVLDVPQVASSLSGGQEVGLFTASNLKNLELDRCEEVDLQMPSFLCGDEDEDAEDLLHQ